VVLYKPWRRRIDRQRAHLVSEEEDAISGDEMPVSDDGREDIVGSSSNIGEVEVVTVEMDGKK
jgi:hypothetical protein